VVKKVDADKLGAALSDVTSMLSSEKYAQVEKATRAAFIDVSSEIIIKTPVDTGRARANWFITQGSPSSEVTTSSNGSSRISEVQSKLSGDVLGKVFYLVNNLPYIGVLEFGGYPKNVKKGSRVKKGKGAFEIRSINGYSKQAPNGFVRLSVSKFERKFKNYLKAFSK
jgi:hypothetical protein